MSKLLRRTRSVCPVCLKNLPAELVQREDGRIYMEKCCPKHGAVSVVVWRSMVDFGAWRAGAVPLGETEGLQCPTDCRSCGGHPQNSCCVLLEVTRRCNLHCRFCFADGDMAEPSLAELQAAVDGIFAAAREGTPLIQLSGGEPTLRDDLPALVRYIREKGGRWVQLNTNGLRLAEDPAYVRSLAEAGLSIVFLQFDGTEDRVYEALRGRPLLDVKYQAIENCGRAGLGVTLVPTVVKGVNDNQIGKILRDGVFLSPVVRGVHFQPVSWFGRIPEIPGAASRYTLDELIAALDQQAGIGAEFLQPSHCDHPGCGFHGAFSVTDSLTLQPAARQTSDCGEVSASRNRSYIAGRWSAAPGETDAPADSFDAFLSENGRRSFTVTAMAFQDAGNLDVERLRRCSLHVYENGRLLPFCAKYLTAMEETEWLTARE